MTATQQRSSKGEAGIGVRALLLSLAVLLVGACSGLPLGGPPPDLYTLTPKSSFDAALPTVE